MPAEDLEIKALWEVVEYDITYVLNDGVLPQSYYKTVLSIVAKTISLGKYDNGGLEPNIYFCDKGVLPNNSLRWQYKILLSYDAELNAYEVVATDAAKASANNAASAAGVTWTHAIASADSNITTLVYVGQYVVLSRDVVLGDKDFTANVGEKDNIAKVLKEFTYNIEEEYVSAAPTKEHYEFAGWAEGEKIEKGSTGAKTLTAEWTPVEYKINYVLGGGTNHASNPSTYNIENEITLQNPTREHYEFVKWTEGSTISVGSYGEKKFTAEWTPVEYEITLVLNGGEGETSVKYNIETETFELPKPARNNYAFKGWFANEDLSGDEVVSIEQGSTGAKTYYAKWEEAPYLVEYETNGGNSLNPTAFSVATGKPQSLPIPVKTGYDFVGWYDNEELSGEKVTAIAELKNYKLYASWTPVEYGILYELNGGTNHASNPSVYTIESETITLEAPTRSGYNFIKWIDSEDNEVAEIKNGTYGVITLTAVWELTEYNISYELNGGDFSYHDMIVAEWLKDYNAYAGTSYTTPAEYQKDRGTAFWKSSSSYYSKWGWVMQLIHDIAIAQGIEKKFPDYVVQFVNAAAGNVTSGYVTQNVPAFLLQTNASVWNSHYRDELGYNSLASKGLTYDYTKVTIDVYRNYLPEYFDSIFAEYSYNIEKEISSLVSPVREYYTFAGWYDNAELTGEAVTKIAEGSTGDVKLYAKWTPVEYTITLVPNEGTVTGGNTISYTIEDLVTLPTPTSTREHYEFAGWYTNPECTGDVVISLPAKSTGNKTYYAKWTPVEYEITLNLDGGAVEGNNPIVYTIETETFTLPIPTKVDYVFNGWYDNEELQGEEITAVVTKGTTGNKVYYAKWVYAPYEVTYHTNGGTYSKEYEYFDEETIPTLSDPSRTGYKFLGWYDNEEFEGSKIEELGEADYQLYAKWEIITYTINYTNEGNAVENPTSYTIETETFELEKPTRTGYEFAGWFDGEDEYTEIEKGSTGSLNLVAKWDLIEYTISYNYNGGALSPYASYEEMADDLLADYNAVNGTSHTKATLYALGSWSESTNGAKLLCDANYRAKWEWLIDFIASKETNSNNSKAWKALKENSDYDKFYAINPDSYPFAIGYALRAFIYGGQYTKNSSYITLDYSDTTLQQNSLDAYRPIGYTESYTVEEEVVLPTPYKVGYYFKGWAEGNVIEKGSTGNKSFTAQWTEKAAFIGETGYDTVAAALEAANEGDTIKVALGTFAESLTVNKNNITIEGVLSSSSYATLSSITISGSNVKVQNIKVTADTGFTINGSENITIDNCYVASSGTHAVKINADTSNFTFTNSTLYATNSGVKGIYSTYVVTNAEISNNTFINTNGTSDTYPDAIRLQSIAGTIVVENNIFDFPGGNYTVFLGLTSAEENTRIEFNYNTLTSTSSYNASGFSFRNLKSSCIVNVIGNTFTKVGGTVMDVRGSSNTTATTVNIKNNAINDTSTSIRFNIDVTNITFDSNYLYKDPAFNAEGAIPTVANPKADAASALAGAK